MPFVPPRAAHRRAPAPLVAAAALCLCPPAMSRCSDQDIEKARGSAAEAERPPQAEDRSPVVETPPPAPAGETAEVEGLVPGLQPDEDPPLYGRAVWNVVTIYEKPDMHSDHLGYLRGGGVVVLDEKKVKDRSAKIPRCRKGWWRLADGGGYICSSRGVEAAHKLVPSTLYPSPPSLDTAMPYRYGHVMVDLTPLYERIPTSAEQETVEEYIERKKQELKEKELARQQAEEAAQKAAKAAELETAAQPPPEMPAGDEEQDGGDEEAQPSAPQDGAEAQPGTAAGEQMPEEQEPTGTEDGDAGQEPAGGDAGDGEQEQDEGDEQEEDEQEEEEDEEDEIPFDFVRMLMLRGFYVSIDREMVSGGVKWYRTVRGQFVKADKVFPVDIRIRGGAELAEGFSFPAGIVLRENIFARKWNSKRNHIVKNRDVVYEKFFVFRIFGKQIDVVKGIDAVFYETDESGDDMVLSWSVVPMMEPEPPPHEVPEGGKWIHVDVGSQTLTAYEGERPVFLTLVSTGNEEEDEEYATVRGTFAIQSKHVSATMDNLAMEEAYSIEDVPWTMYFHSSYAIHGAFWHSVFGHQRSHGCVNMTPRDAKWIFDWSEPSLPLGWHGVVATRERPGTWVKVTD
jgi:hypothetical protein